MRLCHLLLTGHHPGRAPPGIFGGGYCLQVRRVDARPIAAEVVYLKTVWNLALVENVGNSMRSIIPSLDCKNPVTVRGGGRPEPASAEIWSAGGERTTLIHLRHKSFNHHNTKST